MITPRSYITVVEALLNHPWLSEIPAPVGSQEVMSLLNYCPLQIIAWCRLSVIYASIGQLLVFYILSPPASMHKQMDLLWFAFWQCKGQGHLICWYAFPPIVAKWTRPKLKTTIIILFFYCPPTQDISLELLVPQKWFTYRFLWNLTKNTTEVFWKWSRQQLLSGNHWKNRERNGVVDFSFYFFRLNLEFKGPTQKIKWQF